MENKPLQHRPMQYKKIWEQNPAFSAWITQGSSSKKAQCTVCNVEMAADIYIVKSHGRGAKHRRRLTGDFPKSDFKEALYNPRWEKEKEYRNWLRPGRLPSKAECAWCDVEFRAERTVVRNHAKSMRHHRAKQKTAEMQKTTCFHENDSLSNFPLYMEIFQGESLDGCSASVDKFSPNQLPTIEETAAGVLRSQDLPSTSCTKCGALLFSGDGQSLLCLQCAIYCTTERPNIQIEAVEEDQSFLPVIKSEIVDNELENKYTHNGQELLPSQPTVESNNHQEASHVTEQFSRIMALENDFTEEIKELTKALKMQVLTLSTQATLQTNCGQTLGRLNKVVALLARIKRL